MKSLFVFLILTLNLLTLHSNASKGRGDSQAGKGLKCGPSLGSWSQDEASFAALSEWAKNAAVETLGLESLPSNELGKEVLDQAFKYAHRFGFPRAVSNLINYYLKVLGKGLTERDQISAPEVYVLTHIVPSMKTFLLKKLSAIDSKETPIIALASNTPSYSLGQPLYDRVSHLHYSQDGELNFSISAQTIHLMGGMLQSCLKETAFRILGDNFLKCENCKRIRLIYHLDSIYIGTPERPFAELPSETRRLILDKYMLEMASLPGSRAVEVNSSSPIKTLLFDNGREVIFEFRP